MFSSNMNNAESVEHFPLTIFTGNSHLLLSKYKLKP